VPAAKNPLVKAGLGGTFSYFELGEAIELKNLLAGKQLPTWLEMARYVFYTTTGEEFTDNNAKADKFFAGKTQSHAIYVFYKPDIKWLKDYKFTLKEAEDLRKNSGTSKHITVYAPAKYVDNNSLEELNMSFCQLPYEIYKLSGN
jgi:adenine-specific DNA-methyltransferase